MWICESYSLNHVTFRLWDFRFPFPPLSMPVTEASYRSTSAWLPRARIYETFPGSAVVWTAVELSSDWSIDWLMYHSRCPGKTWWFWPRSVCWLTKSWSPQKSVDLGNSAVQNGKHNTSEERTSDKRFEFRMYPNPMKYESLWK